MKFFIGFMPVILLLFASMQVMASECTVHRPSSSLKYVIHPVQYVTSMYSQEMEDLYYGEGYHFADILGITGGDVGTELSATFDVIAVKNNLFCLQAKYVEAVFYASPKIYIAKNFKRGSCEYNNILKHEYKHVKILERAHEEYRPKYEAYLQKILYEIPVIAPVSLKDVRKTKEYLLSYVRTHLVEYMKRIRHDVALKQKPLDSPEAYRNELSECKRWRIKLEEE